MIRRRFLFAVVVVGSLARAEVNEEEDIESN